MILLIAKIYFIGAFISLIISFIEATHSNKDDNMIDCESKCQFYGTSFLMSWALVLFKIYIIIKHGK